ncbi:MAG: hydrogen gas-evolving membrane-bound hydrogenase subunit E [Anaerovoracaceae bacterium]
MMDRRSKLKTAGLVLVILLTIVGGLKVGSFLPIIGAHETPANIYLSNYYIENAMEHTHAANIVTAVLADYRGFDTLFETCVLFLSGIGTLMVLFSKAKVKRRFPKSRKTETQPLAGEMIAEFTQRGSYSSGILDAALRIVMPFIMIYAIYVLMHGELSLGGGFQAGALLACAYLIDRISPSFESRMGEIKEENMLIVAGLGTFLYAFTGILPMFFGGNFLEYAKLPFGPLVHGGVAGLHAAGILMIEIGVTVCVMAVIMTILEVVLERTDFDDD